MKTCELRDAAEIITRNEKNFDTMHPAGFEPAPSNCKDIHVVQRVFQTSVVPCPFLKTVKEFGSLRANKNLRNLETVHEGTIWIRKRASL